MSQLFYQKLEQVPLVYIAQAATVKAREEINKRAGPTVTQAIASRYIWVTAPSSVPTIKMHTLGLVTYKKLHIDQTLVEALLGLMKLSMCNTQLNLPTLHSMFVLSDVQETKSTCKGVFNL